MLEVTQEIVERVDREHFTRFHERIQGLTAAVFPLSRKTLYNWQTCRTEPRTADVLSVCAAMNWHPVSFTSKHVAELSHDASLSRMIDHYVDLLRDITTTRVFVTYENRQTAMPWAITPGKAVERSRVSYASICRMRDGNLGRWYELMRVISLGYGLLPRDFLLGGRPVEGKDLWDSSQRERTPDATLSDVSRWVESLQKVDEQ